MVDIDEEVESDVDVRVQEFAAGATMGRDPEEFENQVVNEHNDTAFFKDSTSPAAVGYHSTMLF